MPKKRKTYKLNGVVLDLNMPLSNGLIVNKETAMKMVEAFNSERSGRVCELNHDVRVIGEDLCKASLIAEHLHVDGNKVIAESLLIGELTPSRVERMKDLIEIGNACFAPILRNDLDKIDLASVDIVHNPTPNNQPDE